MKGENGDFMENVFTSEKKLGFGLMRLPLLNPNDGSSIDIELTKKMVDTFLEKGFTYFDTAWMYCGFKSENAAKEALVSRHPRESYTLATKLHAGFIKTLEDRDKVFNEQREKFIELCRERIPKVETGIFGADMKVRLENDGPFTIVLDSRDFT